MFVLYEITNKTKQNLERRRYAYYTELYGLAKGAQGMCPFYAHPTRPQIRSFEVYLGAGVRLG